MTAALHDDVVTNLSVARSTAAPTTARATKRPHRAPIGAGDPLLDGAARLLSIPLRQVYAVLWRVGLIEVTA